MLFNSYEFLIFFPVVILYFLIPHRYRWIFLTAASYYFYMCWKAEYIILIISSTLVNYFSGLYIEKFANSKAKKNILLLNLLFNLGILFAFKYLNFFSSSIQDLLSSINIFYEIPSIQLLLPVGISFYTFIALGYTIDVYKGVRKAEYHLGYFAAYLSFFPQLLAGPIARSTSLLPQFSEKHDFDSRRVSDGLKLMLWGFFKKIVIADRLAILVKNFFSKGKMKRNFIYIDNFVDGIINLIFHLPQPNPNWNGNQPDSATSFAPYALYNIGNNQPVDLMKFIEVIENELCRKAKINFFPIQPGDVPETYANVDDLEKAVGIKPNTPIEVDVKKFIEWFKDYYKS